MKININNAVVSVKWIHYNDKGIPNTNTFKQELNRRTICKIEIVSQSNNFNLESEGTAKLSKRDNYNKEIGRKLSLKKALANLVINSGLKAVENMKLPVMSPDEKRKIWQEYRTFGLQNSKKKTRW